MSVARSLALFAAAEVACGYAIEAMASSVATTLLAM